MRIRPGNAQHIGSRDEQQDSFAFSHIEDEVLVSRAGVMAVVADGMGGLVMGKEASDCTVKKFLSLHETAQMGTPSSEILQKAVESANNYVLDMAQNAGVAGDVGSTLAAVIIKDSKLYWISVGDSRIYIYRKGELVQLTTDQNYATELLQSVANGRMSMEEAQSHPDRAALTNFIGNQEIKPADYNRHAFPIYDGDWIILCSDGLFGTLTDDEVRKELYGSPHDSCERLIKKVVSRNKPYQDNITVVILACGDSEPTTVRTKKTISSDVLSKMDRITKPVSKRKKTIWIIILAGMLIISLAIGGMTYYFWPQVHKKLSLWWEAITTRENIQKQSSVPSETKENIQEPPVAPSDTKESIQKPSSGSSETKSLIL